ncbi:MAG: 30S ribosomal protein S8 [Candidatus Roizmanbacteria bacterium GW2011_GWA2_36_23]|uniref:Small ribosomal subunit protein uS8 n=1 Tax=Candidatus Roizmanbacteria bacterium GW2011_GWA2_36_23 TaxID=1618480 RepID=A0A0G0E9I3_9BACT|nr:MAG: 30S ribosomal protein S8 [Candidatus Roizmanbacteria bacterium GW2011_GWA2_36_23]
MTNSFIDLIIRIKNGYLARNEIVTIPFSTFKEEVVKKLIELQYVKGYETTGELKKEIGIQLIYHGGQPAMSDVKIFSKPGQKNYVSYRDLKSVISGYGFSILSTSKGILTDREAKKQKIGGELLFSIW